MLHRTIILKNKLLIKLKVCFFLKAPVYNLTTYIMLTVKTNAIKIRWSHSSTFLDFSAASHAVGFASLAAAAAASLAACSYSTLTLNHQITEWMAKPSCSFKLRKCFTSRYSLFISSHIIFFKRFSSSLWRYPSTYMILLWLAKPETWCCMQMNKILLHYA